VAARRSRLRLRGRNRSYRYQKCYIDCCGKENQGDVYTQKTMGHKERLSVVGRFRDTGGAHLVLLDMVLSFDC